MSSKNHLFFISFLILLCIFIQSCMTDEEKIERKEKDIIRSIIDMHKNERITEYKLLRQPNMPPEKIHIYPEWKKTSHLIISYPTNDLYSNDMNETYISLIKELINDINILILVPSNNLTSVHYMISLLRNNQIYKLINEQKVQFLTGDIDSRWVRDYGPFFGNGDSGKVYLIDTMYFNVRSYEERINDDLVPHTILDFLRGNNIKPLAIRPPFILDGGNFYTDGKGICFTSTDTLRINGKNEEEMNILLKYYFGCKETVYLSPLPGPTIKHIDMFFKLVNPNTILLGEYNSVSDPDNPSWFLQNKAKDILDKNQKIILDTLGKMRNDLRIIRFPMPNIGWEIDKVREKEIVLRLKEEIFFIRSEVGKYLDRIDKGYIQIPKDIYEEMVKYEKILVAIQKSSVEKFLGKNYKKFLYQLTKKLEVFSDNRDITRRINKIASLDYFNYRYPTYLNSTFIKTDTKDLLIVPRFSQREISQKMERIVIKYYKNVYPNAKIVFISSDYLIPYHGAIHCITNTIPQIDNKPLKN